jgi:hypothetical protein
MEYPGSALHLGSWYCVPPFLGPHSTQGSTTSGRHRDTCAFITAALWMHGCGAVAKVVTSLSHWQSGTEVTCQVRGRL